jgi:hypothetical protein
VGAAHRRTQQQVRALRGLNLDTRVRYADECGAEDLSQTPFFVINREITLTLRAGKLKAGAAHRLILEAACSQSHDKPAMHRATLELVLNVATVPMPPTVSVLIFPLSLIQRHRIKKSDASSIENFLVEK